MTVSLGGDFGSFWISGKIGCSNYAVCQRFKYFYLVEWVSHPSFQTVEWVSHPIFVLCMERLSVKVHQLVDFGAWKPIRIAPQGPSISHLFFADDVLIFCKATMTQVHLIVDTLRFFCESLSLKINMKTSKAIFSKGVTILLGSRFVPLL